ncbi:MAG TPA: hypothetical protein VE130_05260 [Nitrososphaeraceae archaeon]|jgi:hypothetical protein|nr:hypothetical protein [Nitrososphaeraceae archaeon]
MDNKISLAIISIALASIAIAPSFIMNQPLNAAKHSCEHKGHPIKSEWVRGCKNGWHDCDHDGYNPYGNKQYVTGYKYGWKNLGKCHIPLQ